MKQTFRQFRLSLAVLVIGVAATLGLLLVQPVQAEQPPFKLKPGLDYSTLDPAHRAELEYDERVIQEARARGNFPPKLGDIRPPYDPQFRAELRTGILDIQAYGTTSSFLVKNRWQAIVNGELLMVYAGSTRSMENDELKKGMIIVETRVLDQYNHALQVTSKSTHLLPVAAGPVKIIEERGQ